MDTKKILIIGAIALLVIILVWSKPEELLIDDVCEEVTSVEEDGTLVLSSGLHVRLLGVKENSEEAKLYIKNNIVGKVIQLQHDSGNGETFSSYEDTVFAYASCPDGSSVWRLIWSNSSADVRTVAYVTDSLTEMNEMMKKDVLTEKSDLALYMRQRTFIIMNYNEESIGTGFFINKEGLALTNTHVISDKDEKGAWCVLYEENADGTGVYKERKRNIKNIKYTSPLEDGGMDVTIFSVDLENGETVPYFDLAKKHIPVGEHLGTFGNPHGLWASYTDGTLSSYHATCPITRRNVPMVQYNIPTNQGNSGGPVADKYGQIIAICELGYFQDPQTGLPVQGLNFGVDILAVRQILDSRGLNYGGK